jgi:hypothetical protein
MGSFQILIFYSEIVIRFFQNIKVQIWKLGAQICAAGGQV